VHVELATLPLKTSDSSYLVPSGFKPEDPFASPKTGDYKPKSSSLRKTAVFNSSKQFKQYEWAVMPATAHGTSPSDETRKSTSRKGEALLHADKQTNRSDHSHLEQSSQEEVR
jgi:hypothetical protein